MKALSRLLFLLFLSLCSTLAYSADTSEYNGVNVYYSHSSNPDYFDTSKEAVHNYRYSNQTSYTGSQVIIDTGLYRLCNNTVADNTSYCSYASNTTFISSCKASEVEQDRPGILGQDGLKYLAISQSNSGAWCVPASEDNSTNGSAICEPDSDALPVFEDFFFEGQTLDNTDVPRSYCDGADGVSGCNFLLTGVGACIGDSVSQLGGITCSGHYKKTGVCAITEQGETIIDPTTSGESIPIVIQTKHPENNALLSTKITTDDIQYDDSKKGNCGTVNDIETCLPLVESKQSGGNDGKDLLAVKTNDPQPENAQKVATIQDMDGNGVNIYNQTINNSAPVKDDFDNGSGISTGGGDVLATTNDDGTTNTPTSNTGGQDTGTTNDLLKDIKDAIDGDEVTLPDKGSFDTSTLDQEVTDLKTQIKNQVDIIRAEASALYTNDTGGSGSLYCNRNNQIDLGGNVINFDICLDDYREQLSLIGAFIITMSLILSVFIVLRS